MQKVLIWDSTGDSQKWCETHLEKNEVEVVATITPLEPVPKILLENDAWDWLLIFEKKMRSLFDTTIQALKLPVKKIIYALDANSWSQNPKAIYTLLKESARGWMHRKFLFNSCRELNTFFTCTVEDLSYIATSADPFRMPHMFINRVNWASNDMKRFHELAQKYYHIDDSAGYFLDLGANIGTTGLYFLKKLTPNLRLLAFEPDRENYKMHRLNMILNDLDDITYLVNCGLGNEVNELTLYSNGANPGQIGFIKLKNSKPISTVKVIPLDAFIAANKIPAHDVKYIWIDTEGFEAKVLLGAKNLLKENPAPIFMECNLKAWDESGHFEDMMTLLSESYSHFVHFYKGEKLYPLEALRTMERPNNDLGQIGDIFLIKRGAID